MPNARPSTHITVPLPAIQRLAERAIQMNEPKMTRLEGDRVAINAEYAQMLLDKIEAERKPAECNSNEGE